MKGSEIFDFAGKYIDPAQNPSQTLLDYQSQRKEDQERNFREEINSE